VSEFSDGPELKRIMDRNGYKIAVAESLTTGYIQAAIGATSGSSTFYEGGLTAYNLKQKVALLGGDRQHANEVNCVSARVALEMAKGVAEKYGTDFGIGTTGYAEPSPENNVKTPHAFVAIWRQDPITLTGSVIAQQGVSGDGLNRVQMQHHVTAVVLQLFLECLRDIDGPR
jgi:nicotinamide-nucleotide amidase